MDRRSAMKPRLALSPCPICGGSMRLIGGELSPVPWCERCRRGWVPDLTDSVTLWWNATMGGNVGPSMGTMIQ